MQNVKVTSEKWKNPNSRMGEPQFIQILEVGESNILEAWDSSGGFANTKTDLGAILELSGGTMMKQNIPLCLGEIYPAVGGVGVELI